MHLNPWQLLIYKPNYCSSFYSVVISKGGKFQATGGTDYLCDHHGSIGGTYCDMFEDQRTAFRFVASRAAEDYCETLRRCLENAITTDSEILSLSYKNTEDLLDLDDQHRKYTAYFRRGDTIIHKIFLTEEEDDNGNQKIVAYYEATSESINKRLKIGEGEIPYRVFSECLKSVLSEI
jgi:hypothetical protein